MEYEEFKRHVGKAGLTLKAFAELLGLNPTSITNYTKVKEVPLHLAVIATLMAEMAENKVDFRAILARIVIEPRRSRGAKKGKFAGNPQTSLFD